MFLKMTETLARPDQCYRAGHVYDVAGDLATDWIGAGAAEPTTEIPPTLRPLFDRLEDGAGRPCLFLPFIGEFGHLVMSHLRLVHFHTATEKIVCCRPGEEALFPSADRFVTDWIDPLPDGVRVASIRDHRYTWPDLCARFPDHHPVIAGMMNAESEVFVLRPGERIPFGGPAVSENLEIDVALGVRRRRYVPARNWPHWHWLGMAINEIGRSFCVIGGNETSSDVDGQQWHTRGDTGGAIATLQRCRLYVGTDSGTSHLAAEVGARMLIFRESATGSRDLTGRMAAINPGRVEIMPASAWSDPESVGRRIVEIFKSEEASR